MTRSAFNAASRAAALDALASDTLDVLIIGGGITGAGAARDAAMRGLRVALVERDDFASGTSSRSSRLIHGGVRYLEHGDFHLVFEASRERRVLLTIAPDLVRPLRFTWPVYKGARVPRWKLRAALTLYDALALFRNIEPHHMRSVAELEALEPKLRRDGLVGGATYYDAGTDDARLTLATVRAAADAGALVINHATVRTIAMEAGAVSGAELECTLTGRTVRAAARVIVNATGPWSDSVRQLVDPAAGGGVRGTKGAHITVPRARVGNEAAIAITHPRDGRVMFILPAGKFAIVGTTDTDYTGPLDDVCASNADVEYLLEAANHYAPEAKLARNDVVAAWAGIRPLVASDASTTAAVSREHVIATTVPGMLSVTGGKLTTYRLMGAQIIDLAERHLGRTPHRVPTDTVVMRDESPAYAGAEARLIAPESAWRWGDVRRAVREEMALTVADVLIRRTTLAFELRDNGRALAPAVAQVMAKELGWNAGRETAELVRYGREAGRMFRVE